MSEKGLFLQNIIAIVWDFDLTLTPHYMQKPLFEEYDIDADRFWKEVNALQNYYARANIHVHKDTCYLGHILSYVLSGRMPGLSNAKLRDLGAHIELFPGLPGFFLELKAMMKDAPFREGDLRLEHYVVSTGLKEMIRGSKIAEHLDGIWASEFIETPAPPGYPIEGTPASGPISQIASFLDNTTKTRALFEINKGVNKEPKLTVNMNVPEEERRVPFKNLIYIADGPSDIPSFSVVRKHGGLTLAVYDPASDEQFKQVDRLYQNDKRVDYFAQANYERDSPTYKLLTHKVRQIAERILSERGQATARKVGKEPAHIHDRKS